MISEIAQPEHSNDFCKGMTLEQYMDLQRESEDDKTKYSVDETDQKFEDLYETCRQVERSYSNKMITFCIKQIDEDHYEESANQLPIERESDLEKSKERFKEYEVERGQNLANKHNATMYNHKKGDQNAGKSFRVRHQSNSPFKKELTPNKNNFIKTFYGNTNAFTITNSRHQQVSIETNTLYNKFIKVPPEGSKEKHFKKKNSDDLNNLLQYQKKLKNKYGQHSRKISMIDFKIEGVKDRLFQRKLRGNNK